MNNVSTGGFLSLKEHIRVPATTRQLDTFQLNPGDVLFNSTNSPELVGKSAIFTGYNEPVVFSNHFLRLRTDKAKLVPEYLARWLTYQWQRKTFEKVCTQWVNQAAVRRDDLLALRIVLPSVSEQNHHAALLDKSDRLRRTLRSAQELKDSFLRSVFLRMFYQNETSDWEFETIEGLAEERPNAIRTGPFGSQLLHSEFTEDGIAVLGIDNAVQNRFAWDRRRFISKEKYDRLRRYTVYPGDVLITIMGTCGRCAVVPDDIPLAINTKHLCCITLNQRKCQPVYLQACFLMHPRVLSQLGVSERGAVMPGLNMGIIKDLAIPVPPMSLQIRFKKIVLSMERLHAQQREADRQAEHLFQTLMHRAFQPNRNPLQC